MMKAIRRKNELSVHDKIALLEKTLEKQGSPVKGAKKKKKQENTEDDDELSRDIVEKVERRERIHDRMLK